MNVATDFRTTHWSVVLQAGQAGEAETEATSAALEKLCRTYWYPVYVFVRRQGHGPHDAQDLTQGFFARLLRLNSLTRASPEKGRFRSFLLMSVRNYLADAWDADRAQKRGGHEVIVSLDDDSAERRYQLEPASDLTPEVLFDRKWLSVLLEQALRCLQQEYAAAGKAALFDALKTFLENPAGDGEYEAAGRQLGMAPGTIAVAVHRLRGRYRDFVRAEIAQTVTSAEDMAKEMDFLFGR